MTDFEGAAVVGLGFVLAFALFYRSKRRFFGSPGSDPAAPLSPSSAGLADVAVRRLMLPADVEREIVASLAADREPDESWRDRHDGDWECRYVSVHGESFANPDGVSRQEILRRAKTGAAAFLIPEPTNRFDPDAVAVYVDLGNGETGQIGYLPRGTALGDSVGGGNAVWLAHKRRASGTDHLGATLYMVRT